MTGTRTIATVLLATGLAVCGAGVLQTFLPLRADIEGFTDWEIALLGAAYFGGFILGCLAGPGLIRAVGHIRAFAGIVSLLAAVVLAQALLVGPPAWIGLRLVTGAGVAIVYMTLESWLNDQASNRTRGRVLSAYIIVANLGWVAGQFVINTAPVEGMALFLAVVIFVSLSAVPVALTPSKEPMPVPEIRLDLPGLFRLSPAGTIGCLLVGLVEGAFWSFGPVFGQERGLSVFEVTMLMAAFVMGGTLSQWPVGRLSDRGDRRRVIVGIALASVVTGLVIAAADGLSIGLTLLLALLHGALMIPIYPICIAHVNDYTPKARMVQVSSGLLLVYSVGATLGAPAAAPLMTAFGPGALFVFIAGVLGLLALLTGGRMLLAGRRLRAFPEVYRPWVRTTQSIYEMEGDETAEAETAAEGREAAGRGGRPRPG
ncbi:MFS transporter [Paralimibaculum aggregatum]|uniref:MFS transporter n=1 Tax=Paralimibaculum aggregatum TaxID=3036245 RepID=A0ABQ6LT42_9RHOB|nr:MFS transporter [Limibaculum sp. NKW23]GMG85255.1 MFS transporter [Limibaculum sp. NKW23]